MKVQASVFRYTGNYKTGEIQEIRGTVIQNCCERMAGAWEKKGYQGFIGFGEYELMLNRNAKVNIYHCSAYPEGAAFDELAISFCPFCAEPIEIELVETGTQR